MFISRGFACYSVWPLILICQIRDFSYTLAHLRYKANYAHIVHLLKNAKSRGLTGLQRTLRGRKLSVEAVGEAGAGTLMDDVDNIRTSIARAGACIVMDTVDV